MSSLTSDYCRQHPQICLLTGTVSVALIILFVYHCQKHARTTRVTHPKENASKTSTRCLAEEKVDEQMKELIRSTPIIPLAQNKLNQVNRIEFPHLHSVKTGLAANPNVIHDR